MNECRHEVLTSDPPQYCIEYKGVRICAQEGEPLPTCEQLMVIVDKGENEIK